MGNAFELCGAGNRLSVYSLNGSQPTISSSSSVSSTAGTATASVSVSTSSAGPAPTGMPAGWSYQGCWVDGVQGRILAYQFPDNQANTEELCAQQCSQLGYSISGTEYAVQCFCGDDIVNGGVKTTDSNCNTPCPGNSAEMCGSGGHLTIYANSTPTVYFPPAPQTGGLNGSWTYQGCVEDNVDQVRTFFWQLFFPDIMTPNMCLSRCAEYGYMAAGLGKFAFNVLFASLLC